MSNELYHEEKLLESDLKKQFRKLIKLKEKRIERLYNQYSWNGHPNIDKLEDQVCDMNHFLKRGFKY